MADCRKRKINLADLDLDSDQRFFDMGDRFKDAECDEFEPEQLNDGAVLINPEKRKQIIYCTPKSQLFRIKDQDRLRLARAVVTARARYQHNVLGETQPFKYAETKYKYKSVLNGDQDKYTAQRDLSTELLQEANIPGESLEVNCFPDFEVKKIQNVLKEEGYQLKIYSLHESDFEKFVPIFDENLSGAFVRLYILREYDPRVDKIDWYHVIWQPHEFFGKKYLCNFCQLAFDESPMDHNCPNRNITLSAQTKVQKTIVSHRKKSYIRVHPLHDGCDFAVIKVRIEDNLPRAVVVAKTRYQYFNMGLSRFEFTHTRRSDIFVRQKQQRIVNEFMERAGIQKTEEEERQRYFVGSTCFRSTRTFENIRKIQNVLNEEGFQLKIVTCCPRKDEKNAIFDDKVPKLKYLYLVCCLGSMKVHFDVLKCPDILFPGSGFCSDCIRENVNLRNHLGLITPISGIEQEDWSK